MTRMTDAIVATLLLATPALARVVADLGDPPASVHYGRADHVRSHFLVARTR